MDRAALDAAYNNSPAVADSATRMADFRARSGRLRAARGARLDMRYGPAERNRIDYFAADTPGPVLAFVHGGYWQMRAKEDFSFLAGVRLRAGLPGRLARIAGHNHFTILDELANPDGALTALVRELAAL